MWLFYLSILSVVVLGVYCLRRVQHEFETQNKLSGQTAILVWLFYLLHFALVLIAAWNSIWNIRINSLVSFLFGGLSVAFGTWLYAIGIFTLHSLRKMSGMETTRLISSGIFRWSRNPQNVGWALALLGIALLGKSAMAVFLVVLFGVGFRIYLPIEEKYLEKIFGQEYRQYRASTSRYFGLPKNAQG